MSEAGLSIGARPIDEALYSLVFSGLLAFASPRSRARLACTDRMHLAAQVRTKLVLPVGLTLLLARAVLALRNRWLALLALAMLWAASTELAADTL